MYGFLLQSFVEFVSKRFSGDVVDQIINVADGYNREQNDKSDVPTTPKFKQLFTRGFSIYEPYDDSMMMIMLRAVTTVTHEPQSSVLEQFSPHFLKYAVEIGGFKTLVDLLGRDFSEFLKNLDCLHEYLRHSFPNIRPPSFTILEQTPDGLQLSYKTCRSGFQCLAIGLVKSVAELYFGLKVIASVEREVENLDYGYTETVLNLKFDNIDHYIIKKKVKCRVDKLKLQPLNPEWLFGTLMPYHIAFIEDKLQIVSIGKSLAYLFPNVIGCQLLTMFNIALPRHVSTWNEIGRNSHNLFVIECSLGRKKLQTSTTSSGNTENPTEATPALLLRGQIVYFKSLNCLVFIGVPCLKDVKELEMLGLRSSDLGKADSVRYIMGAALDHNIKIANDQASAKRMLSQMEAKIDNFFETAFELQVESKALLIESLLPRHVLRSPYAPLPEKPEVNNGFIGAMTLVLTTDISEKDCFETGMLQDGIEYLNNLLRVIDEIAEKYNLTKLPSASDEFTLVAGLPFVFKLPVNFAILAAIELMVAILHPHNHRATTKKSEEAADGTTASSTPSGRRSVYFARRSEHDDQQLLRVQIAVDCGDACSSIVSFGDVFYYYVFGKAISNTQLLAPHCPANCITVTGNVRQYIVDNEFTHDYDFEEISDDEQPSLNHLPSKLYRMTHFPGKEALDDARYGNGYSSGANSGVVSETTRISSCSATSGQNGLQPSLLEHLGLNEFLAKVEKQRVIVKENVNDDGENKPAEEKGLLSFANSVASDEFEHQQHQSMLDTIEFGDEISDEEGDDQDEDDDDDGEDSQEEQHDDSKDDSMSSRRPSFDNHELRANNKLADARRDSEDEQSKLIDQQPESSSKNEKEIHQPRNVTASVQKVASQKCLPGDASCIIS